MKKSGTHKSILNLESQQEWLGKNPFTVPENYFETAAKKIRLRAKVNELTEDAFSVPENYQEQLHQTITARIAEEKLKDQVRETGFTVPEGYFNTLQENVLMQAGIRKPKRTRATVFSLYPLLRYAAAACLVFGLGLFTFFYIQKRPSIPSYAIIKQVPTDDIIDYLAFYSETGDMQYLSTQLPEGTEEFTDFFTSEEIEAYLENGL